MLDIKAPKADIKMQNLKSLFQQGIKEGAFNAGRSIQKRITTMLATGERSGVHYKSLPNRSSASGEFPRSQSGALLRSVYYQASHKDIRVGSNVDHATYLTKGVKKAGKFILTPRVNPRDPFFLHAMAIEEPNTERLLREGVEKRIC